VSGCGRRGVVALVGAGLLVVGVGVPAEAVTGGSGSLAASASASGGTLSPSPTGVAVHAAASAGSGSTVVAPVTGLTAVASGSSVRLSWSYPSSVTGAVVRGAVGSTAPATVSSGTLVGSVTAPTATVGVAGLTAGTVYSFSVFGRDQAGDYAAPTSTTVTTAPAPVTGLSTSVTSTSVTLSWTDPSTSTLVGVAVLRATGSTPPTSTANGKVVATLGKPTHTFTDTNLSSATTYSYTLIAYDKVPSYSTPVSTTAQTAAATAPPPVTGMSASDTGTSVTLTWVNPTSTSFTGVMIRRATGSTAPATPTAGTLVNDTAAPATTQTDTGLSPATTYSYALFAHDSTGDYAPAATITTTTTTTGPVAVQHVSGTLTTNTTWSPAQASVYVIDNTVVVPKNVTLTIAPGTIIKNTGSGGITVNNGTLNAPGTASNPITFTSINDDTTGGDTNGDGTNSSPAASSYPYAVSQMGGSISVADVNVMYAGAGILNDDGGNCSGPATVTVTASSFTNDDTGIDVGDCDQTLTVTNTAFTSNSAGLVSYAPSLTVSGSTFAGSTGEAMDIERDANLSGVVLSGTGANSFTGTGPARLVNVSGSTLPAGHSWVMSSANGAVLSSNYYTGAITINGALTLAAGTIEKGGGLKVMAGGSLTAAGTTSSPVTITSTNDSSAGGNTTQWNDTPVAGDYPYGILEAGGSVKAADLNIDYADRGLTDYDLGDEGADCPDSGTSSVTVTASSFTNDDTGIDVGDCDQTLTVTNTAFTSNSAGDGTGLVFRGTTALLTGDVFTRLGLAVDVSAGAVTLRANLREVTDGVTACDWAPTDCTVDATHTSWGTSAAAGPFPAGAAALVCGAVLVSPWVGETGTQTSAFGSQNCDGSPTPDEQESLAAQNFDQAVANDEIDCSDGFQDVCADIESAQQCLSAAEGVAQDSSPIPLTGKQAATDFGSEAVSGLSGYLAQSASAVVSSIGQVTGFAGQILGAAGTIIDLAQAYNQCSP
jgi:hypothetical protein